jgi:hypothetical protein
MWSSVRWLDSPQLVHFFRFICRRRRDTENQSEIIEIVCRPTPAVYLRALRQVVHRVCFDIFEFREL